MLSHLGQLGIASNTETFTILNNHALLILAESFKSKSQFVHQHKSQV